MSQLRQLEEERAARDAAWDAKMEERRQEIERRMGSDDDPGGQPVAEDTPLEPGDRLFAQDGLRWKEAEVVKVRPDGRVKIHWIGWDSNWDEVVERNQLRLPDEPSP